MVTTRAIEINLVIVEIMAMRLSPRSSLSIALILTLMRCFADTETGRWGDQGDGTFRNPIIAGDYSDPDVIRVGGDFYMVASTFQFSPGVCVLHSKDLVNWESISAAVPDVSKLGPDFNWDRMNRYNEGVYAPSIRYFKGTFYVYVNCHSGEGFYQATATNPAGPWTVVQVKDKNGKPLRTTGWTDPCPLFDDDGKAYLASSRPSSHWFGYLFQMTPDGTQLLDADVDKLNVRDTVYAFPDGGTLFSPFQSTEGNKLFKRNGYYYLQHIEFTGGGHGSGTYIMRSKYIYGTKDDGTPGEPGAPGKYDLLKFGGDLPGQGGFVDTEDGRWYWIGQFNRVDADGRKPYLIPVTWIDDWPVPGVDIQNKTGKFAWQLPKPISGQPIMLPQGSDEFNSPALNPQWFWNYQPRAEMWSLTERPGYMRLHAFKPVEKDRFFKIGNILAQRYLRSDKTTATIKMDVSNMADSQVAGLSVFDGGRDYSALHVNQSDGVRKLVFTQNDVSKEGNILANNETNVWLRCTIGSGDQAQFEYSLDGIQFNPFGDSFVVKSAAYRGGAFGLYTYNSAGESGYVDFDFFHYQVSNR